MHDHPSLSSGRAAHAPVPPGAFFLCIALSFGAAAAEPALNARADLGLRYETSEFPVLKIDGAPAIVVPGPRERHSDWYRGVDVNVNAAVPVKGQTAFVANGNIDSRTGAKSVEFDTQIAHADAGVQWSGTAVSLIGRALAEYWKVGGQPYRHVRGVTLDAVAPLNPKVSALLSAEASRFEHIGDNAFLDADRRALTANLRFGEVTRLKGSITLQGTLAAERSRENDPTVDNNSFLYRVAWEGQPAERWKLATALVGQRMRFGGEDPSFGVRREDRFLSFDVSLARRLSPRVSVVLDAAWSRYRSTAEALFNNWRSTGAAVQVEF